MNLSLVLNVITGVFVEYSTKGAVYLVLNLYFRRDKIVICGERSSF